MGSFANYAENKVLDHITGTTSWTMPTTYLALSTADPLDDASGLTEPSGGSYARVATAAKWSAASGGSKTNSAAITYAQSTTDWGTITHWALMDALTSGNMLIHGSLTSSISGMTGTTINFPIGSLIITLD